MEKLQLLTKVDLKNVVNELIQELLIHDRLPNKGIGASSTISEDEYYRAKDLKSKFGLSPNTIKKYREKGVLPHTHFDDSDIFLYPKKQIQKILKSNMIK